MSETLIIWIASIFQVIIAFGLINVWIFRFGRATKYRGAGSHNMKEEFSVYGLPVWFMYIVGFLKIVIAFILLLVLFIPQLMSTLGTLSLILLSVLMLGAITMHIKIKDPFIKMVPAMTIFTMAVLVLFLINFIS